MPEIDLTWLVPADLPAFAGHFEGNPIVPGVVLLDQALIRAQAHMAHEGVPWQVTQAKFLSPVGPGEFLQFILEVTSRGSIRFDIVSDDRMVASGVFSLAKS
jgi:3-hydroxymyristoyl/3-hydroxydecanoyl-(acyl carrier protein) dehydratase